ncbi:hypothetical protein DITRI_Ditri06bG0163700 [Diplodiscus trichospermus]
MFPRCLGGCFFLIFLSISALNNGVHGARFLTEKLEDQENKQYQKFWKENPDINGTEGVFATINREVPSCPDPLHNR